MDALLELSRDPRVTVRRTGLPDPDGNCVVYWMQRAQRGIDNPALNVAVDAANVLHKPVVVFFAPRPFGAGNLRHYAFLAQGITDIAEALAKRNIGLVLRRFPEHSLLRFCGEIKAALVISDENPIRQAENWRRVAAKKLKVPLWTVDADVIVPSKLFGKEQYAAFHFRRRLQPHLKQFLMAPGNPKARFSWRKPRALLSLPIDFDWTAGWQIDHLVQPVAGWKGGSHAALGVMKGFVRHALPRYSRDRNHPEVEGTSQLSPYLHFGHISPLTVALAIQKADAPKADKEAFLNQLITWRELSVNFVHFNSNYDNFESAEPWAHRTLAKHATNRPRALYRATTGERGDPRPFVECRPDANGRQRLDAQLSPHVLGKEDSGMESVARRRLSDRCAPE